MPNLYIIAGPNGAGKTTAALGLLPQFLNCLEYVNADNIAAGLSPFQPETVALQAGRLMLERIHQLAKEGKDFAFETTLASRSFLPFIRNCKAQGYFVTLIYFYLPSPEMAKARVLNRVKEGGHNIPTDVIERRYQRSLSNFFKLYRRELDAWFFYDNSQKSLRLLAKGDENQTLIVDNETWKPLEEPFAQ